MENGAYPYGMGQVSCLFASMKKHWTRGNCDRGIAETDHGGASPHHIPAIFHVETATGSLLPEQLISRSSWHRLPHGIRNWKRGWEKQSEKTNPRSRNPSGVSAGTGSLQRFRFGRQGRRLVKTELGGGDGICLWGGAAE